MQWAGLVGGPALAGACYLVLPESYRAGTGGLVEFTTAGRATLAIMTWMAVWWLTEAIDISATALLPIALSVVALLRRHDRVDNFAVCMMLGIAYAASIGGIGTKIGTPPNGLLLGFIEQNLGRSIGFVEWMAVAMPLVVVFLPLTWLLLTRVLYPVPLTRIAGARDLIRDEYGRLGPMQAGEWVTLIVFMLTVGAWITRPWLLPGLSDAGIVIIAALALFVVPVNIRERTFTLNWETAKKVPWGILILFGGGLSLAALAPGLGISPYLLIVPAAMAASCAFMLPVATPPNAIVFGSGYLTIPTMCKAGIWLNLIGMILNTALAFAVIAPRLAG